MNAPNTATNQTNEPDTATDSAPWHQTACILCESNCGIEVRLGDSAESPTVNPGRRFIRIRGDKAHPASKGYTCEKALRLDHYQNGGTRLTSPLRRREDGTYEEIDWDTAIREIAEKLSHVRDAHGGETIFYYGGGGQGNHLGGAYSGATLRALEAKFRANALSQEKTGEFWVNAKMLGTIVRGDFEHTEVALFVGKNPWQSHGFSHARTTLKEIAKDPNRSIIVIDPRKSETAELADFHLQVSPGSDAWCLAALAAIISQEGLLHTEWLRDHASGVEEITKELNEIDVAAFAKRCGVDEQLLREAARRIAKAQSVAVFEDLGIQMSIHSTLCSYLEKLVWLLTGNLAKPGTQYSPTPLVSLARSDKAPKPGAKANVSPVVGARIISGLVPCNVIPDEILTDHPARYRAMLVETGNPAHSLADSQRMREAMKSLELLVVIDVAMTETARLAHYVLPASSQYEKYEATFFNFDFPNNVFHLRRPLFDALPGTLPEPEIHARIVEAMGILSDADYAPLREAAAESREAFANAFFAATSTNPILGEMAPIVLYRTLGPTLPDGAASAAILWGASHRCALSFPESVKRAGFTGEGLEPGEKLFEAILSSPSGVTFTVDEWDDVWRRVKTPDGKANLLIDELLPDLRSLSDPSELHGAKNHEFPLVLSAGERRSFTANTIFRDNTWRKKDADGALRISAVDADRYGLVDGGSARLTTARASVEVLVEISAMMREGHISLPNGLGVGTSDDTRGIAPNELTASSHRDRIAGTPFHKHVPARLEPVS
jgi:anaerobic selenocysteine-containing dehydrogenase